MNEAIDRFLAAAVRCAVKGEGLPALPEHWPKDEAFADRLFRRIAFHGLSRVLLEGGDRLAAWSAVGEQVREEARAQSFWELGHRQVCSRMIASFDAAGIASAVTEGTALAYSVYPDAAMLRRGDSDVLLDNRQKRAVRRVLREGGFRQLGDARPLQESWASECPMGFTHSFDLHWRINASPMIAQCLERGRIGTRTAALARLAPQARAITGPDNLVLVAINRASHGVFGYQSDRRKLFEGDRLI